MNNKGKGTREYIEEFILYKHSLGYVYETPAYYLRKYAAFEEINCPGSLMARETVDRYLDTLGDTPGNLCEAVCAMRGFSRHLLKQGIDAYMIPPKRVRRLTPDPPYFFTREEIGRFFSAVDSVESLSGYKGRELILPALFRLLYCCGIRCREARMLRLENVSLADGFIDILQSKGPKSRRLYISGELKNYLLLYDQKISVFYPAREYFFPGCRNHPYISESFISCNFHRCWDKAFPGFSGEIYPRAYDFRYPNLNKIQTFCTKYRIYHKSQ